MSEMLSDFLKEREGIPEKKLLSFELQGKNFDVFIQLLPTVPIDSDHVEARDFEIKVVLQNGNDDEGILGGVIQPSSTGHGYDVNNIYSINNRVDIVDSALVKKEGYTAGLIAETIRQLILQDVVTKWLSARTLTTGGTSLYEKLKLDYNLTVEEQKSSGIFMVTKKISIET